MTLDSLPNDKFFNLVQIESNCRRQKKKVLEKIIFVFDRVENIVGKGQNAGYQHFLLFPQCFQKAFYSRLLKVGIMWYRVKRIELLITSKCM